MFYYFRFTDLKHFPNLPKNYIILIILSLFVKQKNLFGQSIVFRKYQVENGLSNNATVSCLQDSKGFMWFGTKDGLNRFDGYTFKIFRNDQDDPNSLGNNFVYSISEDRNNMLWIGTEKGIYKYNPLTEKFLYISAAGSDRIKDIKIDPAGNIWFIAGFTLAKYQEKTNSCEWFDRTKFFDATSICITDDGAIWAASSTGFLYSYNPSTNHFIAFDVFKNSQATTYKWIEKIYSKSGYILIGTSNQGVKLFDIKTFTYKDILTYNEDKTGIFARTFVSVSDNECWIGTESGIFIYDLKNNSYRHIKKEFDNPDAISDNAVYSFCKDKEGGMWVCTYFGGINYYPIQNTPFKKFYPKTDMNSLSGNVIREIHEDNDGNLWIGTEDGGLNKLNIKTQKFDYYKPTENRNSISYSNIHGLLVDGTKLWVGTFEHGLDVMEISSGKVIKHYAAGTDSNSLKSNFIYCINKLNNGDIVIGTTIGAYLFNKKKETFNLLPGMPLNNWYTCLQEDKVGIIWAGTYGNGLNYYDTKTKRNGNYHFNAADKTGIPNDRINNIFQDTNDDLWIATESGLCKVNRNKKSFEVFTTKNGLPSNFILSILEDNNKNLWVSTSKGLVRFNTENYKTVTYTTANGLLNDQFNFNSAYKDKNGKMFFGSVKGMISFDPQSFTNDTFVPPVYLTSFQVFNKDLQIDEAGSPLKKSIIYSDKITLTHQQSTINIGFAALSFSAPEISEYAYKMEGLDDRWTYLKKNRNAYFTELSSGTYTFKVKASNKSGVWSNIETKIIIEVLPPWWLSKLAYGCYVLFGLLCVYFAIRYYHQMANAKNRRKFQLLEIAKEKEIYKAKLDFFINVAHEINTPLTLIKAPLEKVIKKSNGTPEIHNYLKIMERNTDRLIELTSQLLDFRQTEIQGFRLNFTQVDIVMLLQDIFNSFIPLAEQKNIAFNLQVQSPSPILASVDTDAFNKIISNLLNNAIKYAATKAFVVLGIEPAAFIIEVTNDGFIIPEDMADKIFEPFVRLKQTEKQKGTGIGLTLSLSLAHLHQGTLTLKKPDGKLNTFVLSLPIEQSKMPGETHSNKKII